MSRGHFIERCKFCQGVIAQCICNGPKTVTWGICSRCKDARKKSETLKQDQALVDYYTDASFFDDDIFKG